MVEMIQSDPTLWAQRWSDNQLLMPTIVTALEKTPPAGRQDLYNAIVNGLNNITQRTEARQIISRLNQRVMNVTELRNAINLQMATGKSASMPLLALRLGRLALPRPSSPLAPAPVGCKECGSESGGEKAAKVQKTPQPTGRVIAHLPFGGLDKHFPKKQ